MNDLEFAIAFATKAHAGQVDKAGIPYVEHPKAVSGFVNGETNKIVAMLHDVCEDTAIGFESIYCLFGKEIGDAVEALTRRKGEAYVDYVRRLKNNKIAKTVKYADLKHNMDLSRLPFVDKEDLKRLEKYKNALRILEE